MKSVREMEDGVDRITLVLLRYVLCIFVCSVVISVILYLIRLVGLL